MQPKFLRKNAFFITTALLAGLFYFVAVPLVSAQEGIKSQTAYNRTQGREATTVDARAGDIIEYTLTFLSTANQIQNVVIENDVADILDLAEITNYNGASLSSNILKFPTATESVGSRLERTFVVKVKDVTYRSDLTMSNTFGNTLDIKVVSSTGTSSTSSTTSTEKSHTAYNLTQSRVATAAKAMAGDLIEYTLTYNNITSYSQTVTVELDVTDILYLADLTRYGGATLTGANFLRYPQITVPAGSGLTRTFEVKVKSIGSSTIDNIMSSTYGNGLDIYLAAGGSASFTSGQVKGATYVAPATGPEENFALWMAVLFTTMLFVYNKRKARKTL